MGGCARQSSHGFSGRDEEPRRLAGGLRSRLCRCFDEGANASTADVTANADGYVGTHSISGILSRMFPPMLGAKFLIDFLTDAVCHDALRNVELREDSESERRLSGAGRQRLRQLPVVRLGDVQSGVCLHLQDDGPGSISTEL